MSNLNNSWNMALAGLLKDKVRVPLEADGSIILRERSANMKVCLPKSPYSLVVINLKKFSHLSMLIDGECKKMCDYLLITESDNELHACFVELKKTLNSEANPREQLRRSLPILEYLRSACDVERESKDTGTGLTVQYNLIAERRHKRIDKQRVKRAPSDSPEVECYRGIEVRKFVGSRIVVSKLL